MIHEIHFGGGFAYLFKVTIESHSTEGCSQNTCFASIFLVYVLSDNSIIILRRMPSFFEKVHPGMVGL